MEVHERLRLARLRAGFSSQKAAADALGIERTRYLKYENGTYSPPLELLVRMCRTFDVSANYILGLVEEPAPIATDALTTDEVVRVRKLLRLMEEWNEEK